MATLADPVQPLVVPLWGKLVAARSVLVAVVSLAYGTALALDGLALLTPPFHPSDRATGPLLLLSPWFFVLGTLLFMRAFPRRVRSAAYLLFASAACALALAPGAEHSKLLWSERAPPWKHDVIRASVQLERYRDQRHQARRQGRAIHFAVVCR